MKTISDNDIAKAVQRIQERDGVCSPEAFVEEAKNETSPLHALFEWDDEVEAARWRVHRARQIIGRISIYVKDRRTPAHVHVTIQSGSGERKSGYVPVEVALSDAEMRAQVFREAATGLQGWRSRLQAFTEASEALVLLDGAVDALTRVVPGGLAADASAGAAAIEGALV